MEDRSSSTVFVTAATLWQHLPEEVVLALHPEEGAAMKCRISCSYGLAYVEETKYSPEPSLKEH